MMNIFEGHIGSAMEFKMGGNETNWLHDQS